MKIRNIFGNVYRGALGKAMVGSKWKSVDYIRKYVVPTNPKTQLQRFQRNVMDQAITTWPLLTREQQRAYNRLAEGMSGFNEFTRRLVFLIRNQMVYILPMEGDTKIVDPSSNPIPNATIVLSKGTKIVYKGMTNAAGKSHYALTMEDGPYDVLVTALGFQEYRVESQLPGDILTTITLTP